MSFDLLLGARGTLPDLEGVVVQRLRPAALPEVLSMILINYHIVHSNCILCSFNYEQAITLEKGTVNTL